MPNELSTAEIKKASADLPSDLSGEFGCPKVLIVDDRKANLIATRKILRGLSCEIFEANSGNEALKLLLKHNFACVLLDVQMPEMNGFEVASIMHDQPSMSEIPIIFVTAISKEEKYVDQAAELGAVDYIFKPVNANILRSKIKVYLDLFNKQKKLHSINKVLAQNNDELERFAYICSHDLQEPARMMCAYSELLGEMCESKLEAEGLTYLAYLQKNAKKMQKMIKDILFFSRIGREKVDVSLVNPHTIIESVLEDLQSRIEKSGAKIICHDLPEVHSNQTMLNTLFLNLIGNAIKFVGPDMKPEIEINCEEDNKYFQFSISDNGIGIDPNYQKKVFGIFEKIHSVSQYPGTGIGLSTCMKFIQLYGGKIWFESKLNTGTTFYFKLPKNIKDLDYAA